MQIPKNKRLKSKKITDSAKNENCTLRISGVCNFNPETTVFAHINGAGMGIKAHDIHGCYACSNCHTWIDEHRNSCTYDADYDFFKAMIETQSILIQKGLIKI